MVYANSLPRPVCADAYTVALTLYGEARGQSMHDRLGVLAVIRERVLRPGWWGRDWQSVCKAPWQFSCWHTHDEAHRRNHRAMLRAEEDAPKLFRALYDLAHYAVHSMTDGDVDGLFDGGRPTHYYSRPLTKPPASWGKIAATPTPRWGESAFTWCIPTEGVPRRA